MSRRPQRIVIDLYPHTPEAEVVEILDSLRGIGIDDARAERWTLDEEPHVKLNGWKPIEVERPCPDCGSSDWAGVRCYGDGHGAA